MTGVLEARGLSKRYGAVTALNQLNLTIAAGEIVCLLGANGAGKSTTLNLFLGFLAPSSGEARVCGCAVHGDPRAAREKLGYVPEVVQLSPLLTGIETLRYFNDLSGAARLSDAAAGAVLSRAGLQELAHRQRVGQFSKGMRQKLGLAVALAKDARAFLLDEPLSGLDPKAANELVVLLRALADGGTAVLVVTHDVFRAQQMADRIGIMRQGQLVDVVPAASMTAQEIESLYAHHLRDAA